MQSDLEALLNLQEKDKVITSLEEEIEELNPALSELERRLDEAQAVLEQAEAQAEEARQERQQLEAKIETYKVMQERRRQKLESVNRAKDASAIMAEIDLARSVLVQEEAEWLRSADKVRETEQRVEEAQGALEALKEEQAPIREELEAKLDGVRSQIDEAQSARKKALKDVENSLAGKYERIRRGRAPLAVYPMHGGACGHCYTAIPLNIRKDLERYGGAEVCEACGVMIYAQSQA